MSEQEEKTLLKFSFTHFPVVFKFLYRLKAPEVKKPWEIHMIQLAVFHLYLSMVTATCEFAFNFSHYAGLFSFASNSEFQKLYLQFLYVSINDKWTQLLFIIITIGTISMLRMLYVIEAIRFLNGRIKPSLKVILLRHLIPFIAIYLMASLIFLDLNGWNWPVNWRKIWISLFYISIITVTVRWMVSKRIRL